MDIIEAIKERRSVRNYNPATLDEETVSFLKEAIKDSFTLFGGKLTIRLRSFDIKGEYKPSTYGVIKGASYFFLLVMGKDEESALTAGFQFEQIVLKAWRKGLGTCWIAGTFKGSQFNKDEQWPEGESLKIISPVGYPEKKTLFEKLTRFTLGSQNRKPFTELFFEDDFNKPLSLENKFSEPLEMLRLAPSSTNSQPWRALVKGDKVLFYYQPKSPVSIVDCGIGLCHFYETERFRHNNGSFFKEKDYPAPIKNWKYLITYKRD